MMKKTKLISLAMIGISMGLMTICYAHGPNEQKMNSEMQSFYQMLTPDAQKKFLELDETHKKAALEIYAEGCKALSDCKGYREQAVEQQYSNQMQQRQKTNEAMKKH